MHTVDEKLLKITNSYIELDQMPGVMLTPQIKLSADPIGGYWVKAFLWDDINKMRPIADIDGVGMWYWY